MDDSESKLSLFEKFKNKLANKPDSSKELKEVFKNACEDRIITQDILHLLDNVLNFSDLEVRDAMITRSKMEVIKIDNNLEEIINFILNSTHSRFPVIGNDKDEVLGILHSKDLFKFFYNREEFSLKSILRDVFFTPEGKDLILLIKEFKEKHLHLAVVVDEFGGISGIITFEDIIEQLIGEIEDEFDKNEVENISLLDSNKYKVNAETELDEFNEFFNTNYIDEEVDTIAGYLVSKLGRLPINGEQITVNGLSFSIAKADRRRIHSLIVSKTNQSDNNHEL